MMVMVIELQHLGSNGQTFSPEQLHESRIPKNKTPHPSKSKQLNPAVNYTKIM